MKIKPIILLVVLFSFGVLSAQTDFRAAYIIETTGDTVYGEIDYRGDMLMSSLCRFKDQENIVNDYSPNDISAYRFIDSKYYISREINGKNVFLEYLIKGKVNIYYLRDDSGDHYYIDKENERLIEIPYEEGTKYVDDKLVAYETTKHIGLLTVYMQDAPELLSRINAVEKPEHYNLIELAEDYHNAICEGEQCIIYEKQLPLIKVSMTPFVGLTKYDYPKFAKGFGVYVYFWAPRTSEKLFFKTGIFYEKLSTENGIQNTYRIPIQLQYIFRAHKLQPKISGGYNLLFSKPNNYYNSFYTLSLNPGLNYKISDNLSLSTAFNTDFTPFNIVTISEGMKFSLISYSIILGLRIDL